MQSFVQNGSLLMLEPRSYLIYFVVLTLSILMFLGSCSGLFFLLYLSYKEWCNMMHLYCQNVVNFESMPLIADVVDAPKTGTLTELGANQKAALDSQKTLGMKPQTRQCARIAKVKLSTEDGNNEPLKVIEIMPNEFSPNLTKEEKALRSCGPDKELGRLSFRLEYNYQLKELQIGQMYGEGLRKKNSIGILNPFIVFYIWPDETFPIKTSVIKKTNSPRWEETIVLELFDLETMSDKAIHFKVQSWQSLKPNEIIGHVTLPLKVIPKYDKGIFESYFAKNLQPDLQINRGAIKIILEYQEPRKKESDKSDKAELFITILKANLIYPAEFISDQCQVFTKVTVTHPNLPILNKSTSTQRGSFQPVWNEKFIFPILSENISKLSVMISVREEGFSKEGKMFGFVELGPEHSETNNTHLRTVIKKPNQKIIQWHQLISSIT